MSNYPMNYPALSLAQKVRLWFMVGIEALTVILLFVLAGSLNYSATWGVTVANGDATGVVGWLLASQVAVITLGVISFIRFLHPKSPEPPMYHGGSQNESEPTERTEADHVDLPVHARSAGGDGAAVGGAGVGGVPGRG